MKNTLTVLIVFSVVVGMVAMSFAAVPLYNLFCRVTGFAGTTQVAEQAPDIILERRVTVKFNADIARDLFWDFTPEQRQLNVRLGESALASFKARNKTARPSAGTALFNVTPLKAGKYFHKIQCFCFDEQILEPGQEVSMPVLFYIAPEMEDDPGMDDVSTITLSYSFFKAESEALEQALEDFYNEPSIDKSRAHKISLTE